MGSVCTRVEELLEEAKNRISVLELSHQSLPTGLEFEAIVFETICQLNQELHFGLEVERKGPQAFPDIVVNNQVGVEVKFSRSGVWRSLGNSIFEGTAVDSLTTIYLIFGRLNGNKVEVKWANYEDAIEAVRVTHSPRFSINMDAEEERMLFNSVGISYPDFRTLSDDAKMQYIREYFRKTLTSGQRLWWLEADTGVKPFIQYFRDLPSQIQKEIVVKGFAYYPEIVSDSRYKFMGFMAFMLREYQVVHNAVRDLFTAGGMKIVQSAIDSSPIKLPQSLYKLLGCKNEIKVCLENTPDHVLKEVWENDLKKLRIEVDGDNPYRTWLSVLSLHLDGELLIEMLALLSN